MNSVQTYGGEKAKSGEPFTGFTFMYGETICGGNGAGPMWNGVSAIHIVSLLNSDFPVINALAAC